MVEAIGVELLKLVDLILKVGYLYPQQSTIPLELMESPQMGQTSYQ